LTPGIDCVRAMGGARLATDRDRTWELESGEAARGRKGSDAAVFHVGEVGDEVGEGSVDRRSVGGFRGKSKSGGARLEVP
jgi:hypothetical protein